MSWIFENCAPYEHVFCVSYRCSKSHCTGKSSIFCVGLSKFSLVQWSTCEWSAYMACSLLIWVNGDHLGLGTYVLPTRYWAITGQFCWISQFSILKYNEDWRIWILVFKYHVPIVTWATRLNWKMLSDLRSGWAVVRWIGHGSFKQNLPCSIPGGLRWCQEGHTTSNAPVPH